MQSVRKVIFDAPEFIPNPVEFQHRDIELIIKPLDDVEAITEKRKPTFLIADVDYIVMLSREERNA
ncbi:hypothetical protein [Methylovulum psychrotolerans]|uniref:Uncharacterized protein n=1 Tax=Methylovulum psychrotolerans TaxID=1704499 RepID=A0A2S5CTA9_9GAMM|nr:hypothetical protein [Methylovulum psychrotolerans]POZ54016.1 hypothetical protein AADEFJLK_01059 [Methylovulum psychrotolerans]